MTRPNDHTPAGVLGGMYSDIEILKRRTARLLPERLLPGGYDSATSYRGSTAERNAIYGDPAVLTNTQKVELANRQINWFNTDEGWMESYYAVESLPGLTVDALIVGTLSGWYPITTGPRAVVRMTAAQAQTNGQQPTLWAFSPQGSIRRGGPQWFELFDSNKTLRVKQAGHYRFDGMMSFPNGSGTGVCSWRGNLPTGLIQYPVPLLSGFGQIIHHAEMNVSLNVDQGVYFQTDSASWSIGGTNSYMSLTYLGPRLVHP